MSKAYWLVRDYADPITPIALVNVDKNGKLDLGFAAQAAQPAWLAITQLPGRAQPYSCT